MPAGQGARCRKTNDRQKGAVVKRSGGIGKEMPVTGWRPAWLEEERPPIPGVQEVAPPRQIGTA